jgi:hypothetical protein
MDTQMLVKNLIEILQKLPPDLPVMLPAESGVEQPRSVYVAKVAKARHDWAGTPVGQFCLLDENTAEETTGNPFDAVIINSCLKVL